MATRASHHEATFSKSLAWVFFWCLFMFRNDLKNLKNLGRSFHDWKMVLKITNPHYRVKIQNCRRPMVWPIKTCARRALSQREKLELNRTYQLKEKSKKPPKRTGFQKTNQISNFKFSDPCYGGKNYFVGSNWHIPWVLYVKLHLKMPGNKTFQISPPPNR